jgi:hypothetical protein
MLVSSSGNYKYIQRIPEKCNSIAKKNGFECFDFTSSTTIHSGDNEFIDGFHGSEKAYVKMLIKMLEAESILNKKTKIDRLNKDLKNSISDYQVYKE